VTIRRDLQNALESWTADDSEAFTIVEPIVTNVIVVLPNRLAGMPLSERRRALMPDGARLPQQPRAYWRAVSPPARWPGTLL
jgi:hypothetical protein